MVTSPSSTKYASSLPEWRCAGGMRPPGGSVRSIIESRPEVFDASALKNMTLPRASCRTPSPGPMMRGWLTDAVTSSGADALDRVREGGLELPPEGSAAVLVDPPKCSFPQVSSMVTSLVFAGSQGLPQVLVTILVTAT
jgi:hypothetical protein